MIEISVLLASVLLQLTAAVLALRLIRVTGRTIAWIAVALAVLLMAVRRASTLIAVIRSPEVVTGATIGAELIALAISLLLVIGLALIGPMFERSRRTEELEEGFGRVIESCLNEIFITAADDLRFLRVNLGARENLGYSEEELLLMTPLDLTPDYDERMLREILTPLKEGRVPRVRLETRHRRKDGSYYPVDVDIQTTRFENQSAFVAVIEDTSERMDAERVLRESEEHFRSLIEHSQDLTAVMDREMRVVYQSPSIRKILGVDPGERIGQSAIDYIHPDDRAGVGKVLAEAATGVLPERPVIYRLMHADGSWRRMEGVGSVRQLPNGTRQFVVNQRDITDREEAVLEKHRAEALLQHAQRLEIIGDLAGGIAHDFNNLLTPIVGYANLLSQELQDQPEAHKDVTAILKASRRAGELVQQLLVFSRRTEPKLTSVTIEKVVREVMGLVRMAAPKSLKLTQNLDADDEAVLADAIQLHQVLMNLCTNAIDAMKGRPGELTVNLTRVHECPAHVGQPGPPKQGEFVRLSVTDTGDGMDAATVKRVFDPFFTTKDAGKGTGLGLAVVHGIVLTHGGALTVTSTPGVGSTFTVHLPSLGHQQDFQEAQPPTHLAGTEHVLVIDDEQAVAHVVKRLLEPYGYSVSIAVEPADVLTRVQDGETVDLLVTDYDMPLMNGLDLAHEVKIVRPDLPILLITGLSDDATPDRLSDAGVAAMISKPFTGSDLVEQVRSVLDCGTPD